MMWAQHRNCFMVMVAEWGRAELTFGLSEDCMNWTLQRIPLGHGPGSTPLYPSIIHPRGGNMWFDGKDEMRLYYCDSRGARRMMVRAITVS